MFCPSCGCSLPDSAAFCASCGTKLGASAPQAAARAVSVPVQQQPYGQAQQPYQQQSYGQAQQPYGQQPQQSFQSNVKLTPKRSTSFGPLMIVRFAVVIFLAISMFLPWVVNEATLIGYSESVSYSYLDLVNSLGVFLFIAGVALAAVGTIVELVPKRSFGRWISVAGFAIIVFLAVLVVANMSQSVDYSYASESVAPTFVAWLALILSVFGIVTCIIKH